MKLDDNFTDAIESMIAWTEACAEACRGAAAQPMRMRSRRIALELVAEDPSRLTGLQEQISIEWPVPGSSGRIQTPWGDEPGSILDPEAHHAQLREFEFLMAEGTIGVRMTISGEAYHVPIWKFSPIDFMKAIAERTRREGV